MKNKDATRCESGKYWLIKTSTGWRLEHIVIAEQVLGKTLPKDVVIHHMNGDEKDNSKKNLVVCQNQAYHLLLHKRQRAYNATGDASGQLCKYCKCYFFQTDIDMHLANYDYHLNCARVYDAQRRLKRGQPVRGPRGSYATQAN